MAKKGEKPDTPTVENRKARFDYEISETLECGIVLAGSEVKSVREGKVSIGEGYVSADGPESPKGAALFLHGVNIGHYGPAAQNAPPEVRIRKLLAHKKEIARLAKATMVKGVTIVPLKLYFKNGYAKVLIGLGTGRKRHDKREAIKEREMRRETDRAMGRRDR
ncbi:MAG: SsrA-binding protein SmpB [Phycisphaerales bacterium]|nr:SsrA-binding protein SmpB [Phycisphaerales bacterium]